MNPLLRARPLRIAVLWSVPAWLMVLQMVATASVNRTPMPGWRAAAPALLEWYLWVPVTPLVIGLARRFPLGWPPRPPNLAVHAAGAALASGLRGVVYGVASWYFAGNRPGDGLAAYIGRISLGWLPVAAVVYGAVIAGAMAFEYAERSRAERLRAVELEARLATAELDALRANLDPHFLFNALHSIAVLVRTREKSSAVDALATLSDLLREVLRRPASEDVPLEQELGFARRYLSLAELRFQDRLRIDWTIDDSTRDILVPRLLLQPLVENAVSHGIARSDGPGRIAIASERSGERLVLRVADTGPGPNGRPDSDRSGIGLAAVRARLERSYRNDARLILAAGPPGTVATLDLPVRRRSPTAVDG